LEYRSDGVVVISDCGFGETLSTGKRKLEVGGAALRALRLEAKARLQISDWKLVQPANQNVSKVLDYWETG